ncbi:putative amidohydrolase ytcJ [Hordeum vulgare]|nr:putative amidohydrolase ytcJ [Hordeum vulgare]
MGRAAARGSRRGTAAEVAALAELGHGEGGGSRISAGDGRRDGWARGLRPSGLRSDYRRWALTRRSSLWTSRRAPSPQPYENAPGDYGLQLLDMDILLNATSESDKSGLQVAIHAIGDKANDMLLDMFDKVVSLNGMKDRRFRLCFSIEHAQHLSAGAANCSREHGIIASVQPDHLLDDADSAGKKIGVERAERSSYLFLSLLAGGAHLAFGSDWPVSDIYPLQAIKTAMSHKLPGWEEPWISEERLPMDDSLKVRVSLHTISATYACFLDHVVGSLVEGKYADFVVLSSTSWCEFADDTPGHVVATYVNGKQAYP